MRLSVPILTLLLVECGRVSFANPQETSYDGKPLSAWLEQLKHSDLTARRAAAAFLAQRINLEAKDAPIPLSLAMKDNDRRVRADVAKAVIRLGTPGQNAVVARLLEDIDNDKQRIAVFRALGDLGAPARSAGPKVLSVMQANDNNKILQVVGARTVIALDNRSARTLLTVLVNGLNDGQSDVRRHSAEGLGELGGLAANKGTQPLIDALKDNDVNVRLMAAWALARVERREAGRSANLLVEILRTETGIIRMAAIEALAELGPAGRSAVEPLRSRLKDTDPATKLSAAIAIYAIDPKTADNEALRALIAGLKDSNTNIQLAAAEAVKQISPAAKAAIQALLADLKAPGGSYTRYTATLDTMARIGEPSVSALSNILRESPLDPALARAVVECLGKIGPPAKAGVPVLIDLLRDHRNVLLHRFIVATLGKVGPEALPTLRLLLAESDPQVQIRAIQAIGEIGSEAKSLAGELRRLKAANAAGNLGAAIDATLKRIDPIGSP